MFRNYRNSVSVILLCCLFVFCLSCEKQGPVKIGFMGGLTGRVADLGVAGRNGTMLAIEEINASGGIKGRPVELIVRDDKQNSDIAQKMTAELLDLKVETIIGPMTSSVAMAIVPIINKSDIFLVSPTVTTNELSGIDDRFLRVISTSRNYAMKSAHYQFEKMGKRKAVVVYDLNNKAYTENWFSVFKEKFEGLGGQILDTYTFKSGSGTAFFDIIDKLLVKKPDMFLIITNAVDAALICQQVRKLDTYVTIVASEWASTERFIDLGGSATEGVYVSQFLDRNDNSKRYVDFRTRYIDRFGQEPGFAGIAGYDAAKVVIGALLEIKKGESLKDVMIRKRVFQCVQQEIILDQYGDADRKTFITVIQNGTYNTLK